MLNFFLCTSTTTTRFWYDSLSFAIFSLNLVANVNNRLQALDFSMPSLYGYALDVVSTQDHQETYKKCPEWGAWFRVINDCRLIIYNVQNWFLKTEFGDYQSGELISSQQICSWCIQIICCCWIETPKPSPGYGTKYGVEVNPSFTSFLGMFLNFSKR